MSNDLTSEETVKKKNHYSLLLEYLGDSVGLKARTIIIEDKYVSKDFFNEYSAYCSICFKDYSKYCNKLKLDSLAFQEQDSVLSACATTAIWTTLQKAAEIDYQIILKSPYEITCDAGLMASDGGRLFPNKSGLTQVQMCQALNSSGLVVEIRQSKNVWLDFDPITNSYIKQLIYAYSPIGIPIIFVLDVPTGTLKFAKHAVAVTGYKFTESSPELPKPEISWKADDISELYFHDDQWGPFSRAEFFGDYDLNTNWSKAQKRLKTNMDSILIPVFHKIRLSYDDIAAIVTVLDFILTEALNSIIVADFYWAIQVKFSEDLKKEYKTNSVDFKTKEKILFSSLPKYIWVASCYVGNIKVFDFICDATEVANSMFMIDVVSFDETTRIRFKESLLENPKYSESFKHFCGDKFYSFLIENL